MHVEGSNGCGKSSLLRVAAGLLPPYAGLVVRGAAAALVDEAPALDHDRTVSEALAFWARLCGSVMPVGAALDNVGLIHLAEVPVRILSTGQRKRAALARLLIEDRRLWLLDEPANGLDGDGIAMLLSLVAAHRQNGGAVLFASHQRLAVPDLATLSLADYAP
jgi:heme exporter protein A